MTSKLTNTNPFIASQCIKDATEKFPMSVLFSTSQETARFSDRVPTAMTFSKKIELLFNADLLKYESCLSKIYFFKELLEDIDTSLEIKELKELYNLIIFEADSFYLTEIQDSEQYKEVAKNLLNHRLIELTKKLEEDFVVEPSSDPSALCCICACRNIHTTIMPCNHTVCCKSCIMKIRHINNKCPVCRSNIKFITLS